MRVLIADDDREALARYAAWPCWQHLFHCTPAMASDTETALRFMKLKVFDLVITELSLSALDGIALLRYAVEEKRATGVVFMSRHAKFADAQIGIRYRLFDYIIKPVSEKQMERVVKRAAEYYGFSISEPQIRMPAQNMIIHSMLFGNPECVPLFIKEYAQADDPVRLYTNVISAVFHNLPWIEHFLNMHVFYLDRANAERSIKLIEELYDLLRVLMLEPNDCTSFKICNYVLMNIERRVDAKKIAKEFFFNYSYLSQMFKAKTGTNLRQYLINVRMLRACHLIRNTNMNIYDIGAYIGSQNGEHFSSQFRKLTGFRPTDMRAGLCPTLLPPLMRLGDRTKEGKA